MMGKEEIQRVDFTVSAYSEDGPIAGTKRCMSILYNESVISKPEVLKLVNSGTYSYDVRVAPMLAIQADLLTGKQQVHGFGHLITLDN